MLPRVLDTAGARSGGPVAGSLLQSLIALVVVARVRAAAARDPLLQLFTWFSGIAAVGVVLLMIGTSAAVIGFFQAHPGRGVARGSGSSRRRSPSSLLAAIVCVLVVQLRLAARRRADVGAALDPARAGAVAAVLSRCRA